MGLTLDHKINQGARIYTKEFNLDLIVIKNNLNNSSSVVLNLYKNGIYEILGNFIKSFRLEYPKEYKIYEKDSDNLFINLVLNNKYHNEINITLNYNAPRNIGIERIEKLSDYQIKFLCKKRIEKIIEQSCLSSNF